MNSEIAVSVKNISVSNEGFEIINDASADFPLGKSTIIMGPSGCGKSSFLKALAGLIVPDSGTVNILGTDMGKANDGELESIRRRSGFVFQDAALWQNMTVFQNLALPLRFHNKGIKTAILEEKIDRAQKSVGVLAQAHLRPAQLSAGERKLISFARALITDPVLLFLDEPTSFVDHTGIDRILGLLRDLKQQEKTIIAVTSNPNIASMISDYLMVMKAGKILAFDTMEKIVHSKNPEVAHILSDVLSETASYDGDILNLLDENNF